MANWKSNLDIGDIWRLAESDEITPQEFGRRLAERFGALPEGVEFEAVNELLADLYDWGDRGHRCWIERWKAPAEVTP